MTNSTPALTPAFNERAPDVVVYRSGAPVNAALMADLQEVLSRYYPDARVVQTPAFTPLAPGAFGK